MTTPRPPLRLVETARADEGPRPGAEDDDIIDAEFTGGGEHAPDEDPPRPPVPPRFIVLGLIAFQLLGALSFLGKYIALTRAGTVSPAAAVLAAPASACLYLGALLLALRPGRGRAPFLVAAVGLGLSVAFWGISYDWTWPIAFGSMLGLAGAWYARPETPIDEASAAQP